ncbi:hypothetical protein D3C81_1643400 [compost metagenome]
MTFLAGIARPVQIERDAGGRQALAYRLGEPRQLLGAFLLVPQQHEEGAKLDLLGLAVEQHAHGLAGFLAGQAARAALALAEDAHELGERVFSGSHQGRGRHMQFVGLGSPASLAASLAGVPWNSLFRCRLLPLSGPSCCAV